MEPTKANLDEMPTFIFPIAYNKEEMDVDND
jgi:hypothetical protein